MEALWGRLFCLLLELTSLSALCYLLVLYFFYLVEKHCTYSTFFPPYFPLASRSGENGFLFGCNFCSLLVPSSFKPHFEENRIWWEGREPMWITQVRSYVPCSFSDFHIYNNTFTKPSSLHSRSLWKLKLRSWLFFLELTLPITDPKRCASHVCHGADPLLGLCIMVCAKQVAGKCSAEIELPLKKAL